MKKLTLLLGVFLMSCASLFAQAPAKCPDVMLQGFHWDSYGDGEMDKSYGRTKWSDLKTQVNEIASTFTMIWLPPSAKSSGGTGYHPKEWCTQTSAWGSREQLEELIDALHAKNCKVIADIVINHRDGNNNWTDFCNENFGTYGSFTLYDKSTGDSRKFICNNDECTKNGKPATGASDDGYDYQCEVKGGYCASRDLDHSNSTIQSAIKAYLKWMKNEIGYDGWRYDLVKGYLGKYTKMYNEAAGAYYSVGEYWDGNYDAVKNWINDTGKTSTAFDFPNKYSTFNNGLAKNNYGAMINGYKVPNGLCGADEMKRYATTFIDNHDTFRDGSKYGGDWTKANAVLLAQPGIPCVFYPHWEKCKNDIKKMVATRRQMGIHSQSACTTAGGGSYYQSTTIGEIGTLICFVGSNWSDPSGYTKVCSGNGWAYYTNKPVDFSNTGGNSNNNNNGNIDNGSTSTGYSILVNGTDKYNMTNDGAWDMDASYNQYSLPNISLKAGDKFVFYDNSNGATWGSVAVDKASITDITGSGTDFSVKKDGCYAIYLKLKFEADNVYFGNGTDCSAAPTPEPKPNPTPNPTPNPLSTDYYLIGFINGADYASGETDYNITGDYKFVNGKVTVTFTETSYVYVKTGDLSGWFMAQKFIAPNEAGASGKLYNTATDPTALEKIGVPAGTVTFTLAENTDGTLTLSYKMGSSAVIEAEAAGMVIYPNPTNDYIYINCNEAIEEVVINAINGSEVIRTKSNEIDLSSLNPSIYFVNIMLQNGDVVRSKVIRK